MSSCLPLTLRLLLPLTPSLLCPSQAPSLLRSKNPNFNRRSSSSTTSCSSQWQLSPGRRQRFRSYSPSIPMELGLYKAQVMLPFNAFGTMAMAREEFENDSGSSQVFWLLKESELTPSNSNILDGRYAVFGYVTQNEDFLADLKVGDVIESIQVVSGLDNLVNPSYKIAG